MRLGEHTADTDIVRRMELTCPKCHGVMRSYERNGVTIDQCGDCRGLFLDRGELEHLIAGERGWHNEPVRQDEYRRYPSDDRSGYHGQKKKRRSFLEDLFD